MSEGNKLQKAFRILREEGFDVMAYKAKVKLQSKKASLSEYEWWIKNNEQDTRKVSQLDYEPLISVIVPVYNVTEEQLRACIDSVLQQTYQNFELCLADDCSTMPHVRVILEEYEKQPKVKVVYRAENGHISRATNSAIEVATGEFIAFMDCDDALRPNALYEMARKCNEAEYDFIYSDEDKVDDDGSNRHMPHFKPDWAPDTLMANMYTCHFGMYRKLIAEQIGLVRPGFEGAQDYDFTMRFTEQTDRIGHIPKILYHWRERAESTAVNPEAKPYILEAARKTKEEALQRRGLKGELELIDHIYQYRVKYLTEGDPLVSIVIPSKDNYEVYERCIRTLLEKTKYKNFEVITIDNGSNEENRAKYEALNLKKHSCMQYFHEQMEFNFSRMCNIGAAHAKGDYLLFLNDDIEIIEEEWLERMLGQAMVPHTGAVGAKLYYPGTKTIQHDGVICISQGPVHCLTGYDDENIYYFGRNRMDYNYSAVTAACLLVKKSKFEEIGRFDEGLAVAYNDIDLCFKLVEHGYYNIVRNDAILYHHESISRGNDAMDKAKFERLMREQRNLYERHPMFANYDPFYSPNLTQNKPDFSLNTNPGDYNVQQSSVDMTQIKQMEQQSAGILYAGIDDVRQDTDIFAFGWAIVKGRNDNNRKGAKLYLVSDQNCYCYDTTKGYRDDVSTLAGLQGRYNLSAFHCKIDMTQLESGTYQIYIEKMGYIADSFREVTVM